MVNSDSDSDQEDFTDLLAPTDISNSNSDSKWTSNENSKDDNLSFLDQFKKSKPKNSKNNKNEKNTDNDPDNLLDFSTLQEQKKKHNSGTFIGLGLSPNLVKVIQRIGFKNPTPIQRKTIPLILEGNDIVGMARTGSGKTAAFILPLIEKLHSHSASGTRAIILSPSRELALQTIKVFKDFAKKTNLKAVLLVGGDSLDDQFTFMVGNPDVIIATPGRFLHLKIEMNLNLKSVQFMIFDEADRLFEMGFASQLVNIISYLPPSRQTLLFSATLPKSIVEFAQAGLQDPVLVRLDAEQKISENLEMLFFAIKSQERDAALALLLANIIKIPTGDPNSSITDKDSKDSSSNKSKSRKTHKAPSGNALESQFSTVVFVPTRHHVEYISSLLSALGYEIAYIYGSLDQHARTNQLNNFRTGKAHILVVTDLAARGLDIPLLSNVVNYSFPSTPKTFIHRVGRTARAGRRGRAYSLVGEGDVPYLLDLQLFLTKELLTTEDIDNKIAKEQSKLPLQMQYKMISFTETLTYGSLPRDDIETFQESVEGIVNNNIDIYNAREVAKKGEKQYLKTRNSASNESVKRSKQIFKKGSNKVHILYLQDDSSTQKNKIEQERLDLLNKISNYSPASTVFELNKRNGGPVSEINHIMERRRKQLELRKRKSFELDNSENSNNLKDEDAENIDDKVEKNYNESNLDKEADENTIQNTFRDPKYYISHYDTTERVQERGYGIDGHKSFADHAKEASFDIMGDENHGTIKRGMKWDKKKGRYVNINSVNDKIKNSERMKYIVGENGLRVPASFKSGKFEAWKASRKVSSSLDGVSNDKINDVSKNQKTGHVGFKFHHTKMQLPKGPDKSRDDYHQQKKKVDAAKERGGYKVASDLLNTANIAKKRKQHQNRLAKNARPSKKKR